MAQKSRFLDLKNLKKIVTKRKGSILEGILCPRFCFMQGSMLVELRIYPYGFGLEILSYLHPKINPCPWIFNLLILNANFPPYVPI